MNTILVLVLFLLIAALIMGAYEVGYRQGRGQIVRKKRARDSGQEAALQTSFHDLADALDVPLMVPPSPSWADGDDDPEPECLGSPQ